MLQSETQSPTGLPEGFCWPTRVLTIRDFPSSKGMIRRPCFEQMRSLASVDYDDTFLVLDRPSVRRQPLGPVPVGENGKPSCQPVSLSLDLRTFYFDQAGLDCMNTHGSISIVCYFCLTSRFTNCPM